MGLLLTYFCISIFFSFLCSLLEAVLLSVTPAYVSVQKQRNTFVARDLSILKADIDKPLTAILTLNTIAHTVGAIGVGSQAAVIFGATNIQLLGLTLISWEALIAGIMTLAILIFSEVIPKTLGASHWQFFVPFAMPTLKVMIVILSPLIWLSQFITRHLKSENGQSALTRSDFRIMAQVGKESGALNANEQLIINNLLRFNRILVRDIMTPRIVVLSVNEITTIAAFHEQHRDAPFSRIPVFHERNDAVSGYVLRDEILLHLAEGNTELSLQAIKRDILTTYNIMPIPALMDSFIQKKEHMALVVDEFGGMEGIVTMEDVIETLLGIEIVDEMDANEDMQALARKNWELRARRMGLAIPVPDAESVSDEKK